MLSQPKETDPATSTIPYTPTAQGWTSSHPRPLRVARPSPEVAKTEAPALPSRRAPIFHTNTHGIYRLTTHLVPAALPRLVPDIPHPEIPPYIPGGAPRERSYQMNAVMERVLETQTAQEEGRLGGKPSESLLWSCLNRYVRIPVQSASPPGVTLFLAHANGFHKETWETMLRGLLDSPAGDLIDEVWAWEAVQHGDAAIINADNLSGVFDWLDNARDIASFLLYYLPETVEARVLPTRLPCLPPSVTEVRERHGYRTRKLVVLGHSFGGCTSLRVAVDFPKLFSALVLIDPVLYRPHTQLAEFLHQKVLGAFARRDRWSSREEALELFRKSPYFGAWHPHVLRLYIERGLIECADGGVQLKMSGLQEGLSFANRATPWETWELLEKLDERIVLRWIVPEKPLLTKEGTHENVWRRPVNSTNVVFHFAGHLIVQEAPYELARDVSEFLLRVYGSVKSRM